jgi:enamine deaminase RidA (YjgF/YER057c/UK114 family)
MLDNPAVGSIIVGARLGRSENIEDNLRLFEFSLDEESRRELQEAMAQLDPIPGGCGDEYRKEPFLTASGDLSHHIDKIPPAYTSKTGRDGRTLVLSGTPWEEMAGYCRAVREGDRIWVSGTTATHEDRLIGGSDPEAQVHFVIDKIEGALQSLGSCLEDVVRTRIFINDINQWEPVARAHGERFRKIEPANTLVQAGLVGDQYLVEMEVEAKIPKRD